MHNKTVSEVIDTLTNKIEEVMFAEASDHLVKINYDDAWEIFYYLQDFKNMLSQQK